ncbi:MAG: TAXI family TRAP transporter solute-binding subunit [Gemmatimonadales bacterium]|nr:TAXI family TRAP transporter solute-binding subunit [Gemmatimonadales bacterium]
MESRNRRRGLGAAVAIGAALAFATTSHADDYKWPRMLVVGTPGTASGSFASTNGWAPVLQQEKGITVRIVPEDNEPQRYRRLTDRRDIAMSSVSVAEFRFQVEGIGGYAVTKPVAQRILWHHNDSPWGYVVSGNSDLKTIDDIKRGGVRVAQGVFSPPMIASVRKALPGFLGIPEGQEDKVINYVPASSYAENCRSVVEGKADVAWCSSISSVLSEMEGAPGGIRWLPLTIDNKEGWSRFLTARPMLVPTTIDLGVSSARGVHGATSNFVYAVPADADVDLVYNLAKWTHQSFDKYKGTHPLAARMGLEQFRSYLDRSPLPVHEGTVKYLREINAWTAEDDAWNKEAAEKMDKWIAARQAALAEAAKAGIKPDFQDEKFLAVLRKHTEGLEGFRTRL